MPEIENNQNNYAEPESPEDGLNGPYACPVCKHSRKDGHDAPLEPTVPCWWPQRLLPVQEKLAERLESRTAHLVVIVLTLLDLAIVITELSLMTFYPTEEGRPEAVHTAEDAFAWTSVTILSIFTIEQLVKFVVFGYGYFIYSIWHSLDAAIIITSLILEVLLRGAAREVVALLVVARLWRIVRVMHSTAEAMTVEHGEQLRRHHLLERKMQQKIDQLEEQLLSSERMLQGHENDDQID